MIITYRFSTEEQGLVCEVNLEVDDDATDEDIEDFIIEDLEDRQLDWEDDTVYGEYNGNEYSL